MPDTLYIVIALGAILLVLGLAALAGVAVMVFGKRPGSSVEVFPFERRALLSPAECNFYLALRQAVGRRFVIFAKVNIADLVAVKRGTEKRQRFRNMISQKHVDFVLVDSSLGVAAVVELDDSSHNRPHRAQRDGRVDAVFNGAGIPIVHVQAKRSYQVEELSALISSAVSSSTNAPPQAQVGAPG